MSVQTRQTPVHETPSPPPHTDVHSLSLMNRRIGLTTAGAPRVRVRGGAAPGLRGGRVETDRRRRAPRATTAPVAPAGVVPFSCGELGDGWWKKKDKMIRVKFRTREFRTATTTTKFRTSVYPSNVRPIASKLRQNTFQTIYKNRYFNETNPKLFRRFFFVKNLTFMRGRCVI